MSIFRHFFRNCATYLVVAYLFPLTVLAVGKEHATGVVYEDHNGNGVRDSGEPGIADVLISNQVDVVATDENGRYRLSLEEETIIFLTKPAGYDVPLNAQNLPQFYYVHQPKGSPEILKYPGVAPSGPLPQSLDFSLIRTELRETFSAIISGDPQLLNEEEVGYFRDDVVAQLVGTDAAFYMALGDIAYDDLDIYDQYNRAVAHIGIPAYTVHGNHDMNFRAPNDRLAGETFKHIYGPPFYSFDYGKVHFVVLDNVDYQGWDSLNDKSGTYRGYLDDRQLTWLKNDLSHVLPDRLIVLAMHIAIHTEHDDQENVRLTNRERLFDILEPRQHVLALYAHNHFIEQVIFTEAMGWRGTADFRGISTGAACGFWWGGPKDSRGIPTAYSGDGSPNGTFLFTFEGVAYGYRFVAANEPLDYQMRISSPVGIVSVDSLRGQQIVVNIFAADPQTQVDLTVDGGTTQTMHYMPMRDPFMVDVVNQNSQYYPSWIYVPKAFHVWIAPLPAELGVGTHKIEVRAQDSHRQKYRGIRLFEVKSGPNSGM